MSQADRILKGLPPTEPTGILEQMDRMRNGLPREVPTGILAEGRLLLGIGAGLHIGGLMVA
jgi:hypothetical protein